MVNYLSIVHGLNYLTSVISPFTLTAWSFGSCWYCANVSHFMDGWAVNHVLFSQGDNRISNLNAWMHQICTIREMGDHLGMIFFFLVLLILLNSLISLMKLYKPWVYSVVMRTQHFADRCNNHVTNTSKCFINRSF